MPPTIRILTPRRAGVARLATLAAVGLCVALPRAQTTTFRSAVDLVAVDVQVVDHDGRPIGALRPADFDVTIGGRKRRVVSADFIESTNLDGTALVPAIAAGARADDRTASAPIGAGRMFVLAIDTDSFNIGESRDVVAAARDFIRRLQPVDAVGLYTFPVGPRLEPTLDHAAVSRAINTVVGHLQSLPGEFDLTPSEIIDINAEMGHARAAAGARASTAGQTADVGDVTRRVQLRECTNGDPSCVAEIQDEAQSLAFYLEGRATTGLNGLRALIRLLGEEPGRKTVVMFSAGIPTTDRPGGRPEIGSLGTLLGQDAAATDTTIYVLHVDVGLWRSMSAETRKANDPPVSTSRDSVVTGRLLDEFASASGGALIRVVMGGGDFALTRILRETSSHYLLGVEPADSDRDGRLRNLRVKVARKGVTVRSRIWVVVPKRTA